MLKRLGLSAATIVLLSGVVAQAQDSTALADYVSSDVNLFVEFQLPDADVNLARVATVLGRLNDPASAEQMAAMLTPEIIVNQSLQGFSYEWVEPWIGDSIGYVVVQPSNSVPAQLVLVAPVADADAYAEMLEEWAGAPDAEMRSDTLIAVPPMQPGLRAVLFEDVAYFGFADFVDSMFAMHAGDSSLGATTAYQRVQENLPDGFVELYMSGSTLELIGASSDVTSETVLQGYELMTRVSPGESPIEAALMEAGRFSGVGFSISAGDEALVYNLIATVDAEYDEPPAAAKGELLTFIPDDAAIILDTSQGAVSDATIVLAVLSPTVGTVFENIVAGLNNEPTPTPPPTPTFDEVVDEIRSGFEEALALVGLSMDDLEAIREQEVAVAVFTGDVSPIMPGMPGPTVGLWLELANMEQGVDTLEAVIRLSGDPGATAIGDEMVQDRYLVQGIELSDGTQIQYAPLTDQVLFITLGRNAETVISAADAETSGTVARVQAVQSELGGQLDLILYGDLRLAGALGIDQRATEWYPILLTFDTQANGVFNLRLAMYDQE